jgi:PAS domain S-box-containing protein
MKKKINETKKNKSKASPPAGQDKVSDELRSESEEKYRSILENIEDGYYELDLNGNFTFFNDALCRLHGRSREEMIGLNYRQYTDKETVKKLFEAYHQVFLTGEPAKGFGWWVTRKDGDKLYLEISASLKKDSSGQPIGFKGIVRDITDRKQIEKSLRVSEEKYRTILENIGDGYYEVDLNGNFTFFNNSLCKLSGYSKEELLGMNNRLFIDKETSKKVFQMFNKVYSSGEPSKGFDWQMTRKDGTKRYVEASASLRKDSSEKLIGFRGIIRDITERKQTEELLKQKETRYRLLADHMKDQVWLMDFNLNVTYVSPSVEKLLGYTFEELKKTSLSKLLMPESYQRAKNFFSHEMPVALAAPPDYVLDRSVELEFCCKDGRIVWGEIKFSFIRDENGKPISILGEGRDITERKQMEDALKRGEERYRSVFENAGLPLVIIENSLLIFMVNDRFVDISGYEKKEVEGKMQFTDFIASGDRNALMGCFSRRKGDKPVEYECRIAHRNGERFDVLIRIGHIPGAGQFIASFTDITSRKQAEIALLESREHLQKENLRLRSSIRERYRFCDIIGKSQVMQEVYEFILQAAATQANVIIYGESGTGKELVAKAIHETSDRSRKGFVTVHCGAIPETLMESEFFGYKKGAFTGASMDKRGYLDESDGGTLFLDEVGEIGLNMQVKLLRAISGDGYTPVGSNLTKNSDVRIIAATNRNLRDLVKRGVMREDFFYRIHILPIYLPPLRERKDDLPLLVDHFLHLHDKNHPPLPGNVAEALLNYDWPGNIRELQNVLHRYLTLKRLDFAGMPTARSAPVETGPANNADSISDISDMNVMNGRHVQLTHDNGKTDAEESSMALKTFEKDHILKALSENNWHRHKTASALGINRKTLFRKMQKFGLAK